MCLGQCYMNATIQCLSATIPLSRFLRGQLVSIPHSLTTQLWRLDGTYKRFLNRTNPAGSKGIVSRAAAPSFPRVMWSTPSILSYLPWLCG